MEHEIVPDPPPADPSDPRWVPPEGNTVEIPAPDLGRGVVVEG